MKTDVLRKIYGTSLLLIDHPHAQLPVIVPHAATEGES